MGLEVGKMALGNTILKFKCSVVGAGTEQNVSVSHTAGAKLSPTVSTYSGTTDKKRTYKHTTKTINKTTVVNAAFTTDNKRVYRHSTRAINRTFSLGTLSHSSQGSRPFIHATRQKLTPSTIVISFGTKSSSSVIDISIDVADRDSRIGLFHSTLIERNYDIRSGIAIGQFQDKKFPGTIGIKSDYVKDDNYGRLIPGSIEVVSVASSDIPSYIGVKLRTKMTGDAFVIGVAGDDLPSTIIPKKTYDMPSTLGIAPSNKMSGIVNIIEPLVLSDINMPIKDAFIREGMPKLNYGGEQIIATGYSAGKHERLRTLMGFDISRFSRLPTNYELKRAELRLYYAYMKPSLPLMVSEARGEWTEYGLTWDNQPEKGDIVSVSYEVNEGERYISFDLSDFILNARSMGRSTFEFFVEAQDETDQSFYLFSKERGGGFEPEVVIEYFDGTIRSFGTATLKSSIRAVIRQEKDLKGAITIQGYWSGSHLPSSMMVLQPGERISTIRVNRPDMLGSAIVKRRDDRNIPSTLGIREWDIKDFLDNTITVSKPILPASLYVKIYEDLSASIGIRVWDKSELVSWGNINAPSRPGMIYVTPYVDFPGSISIRRNEESRVPSSVSVSRPDMDGILYVRFRSDLPAIIEIRRGESKTFQSAITVSRPDLNGRIKITPYNDFLGNIGIRRKDRNDFPSILLLSRPDLPSSIKVNPYDDIPGTISVRRTAIEEWASSMSVSRPDLPGHLIVWPYLDILGEIKVRRDDFGQFDGTIIVSKPDLPCTIDVRFREDLPAHLTVRCSQDEYFEGKITVSRPELPGTIHPIIHADIPATITIIRAEIEEMDGNLYVLFRDNIPGSIDVWHYSELTCSIYVRSWYLGCVIRVPANDEAFRNCRIVVRQEIQKDIPTAIQLRLRADLETTFEVRRTTDKDLDSGIAIRASSRTALPSQMNVFRHSDLPCDILVRSNEGHDRISTITVRQSNKSDLPGTICVLQYKTWISSITVRCDGLSEMPAVLIVPDRYDVSGGIMVPWHDDLPSAIFPVFRGNKDISSMVLPKVREAYDIPTTLFTIYPGKLDMPSSIKITPHNKMTAKVFVQPADDYDILSSVWPRYKLNLPGMISVRRSEYKDLAGKIIALRNERSELLGTIWPQIHCDVEGTLTARRTSERDRICKMYVKYRDDIPGTIHPKIVRDYPGSLSIRKPESCDMPTRIQVRRSDSADLTTLIWPRLKSDLHANVYIRFRKDLSGFIDINTAYSYAFIM